jgi:hypothetical protein
MIFMSFPAIAARPFVTDDARIVDQGHCQLETFTKSQRTYAGSEFWFLPACNPWGAELTVGWNRIESETSGIAQAKFLFKPLQPNGSAYAASVGLFGNDPYFNGIGSLSFFDDRSVIHVNLGALQDRSADKTRATGGLGLEQLLIVPRLYGILEMFGQSGDKPTLHAGFRIWIMPNRVQIDATHGTQQGSPSRRFTTVGLRLLF